MEIKNVIVGNPTGDYEPKVGGDLEAIRTKRSEARAFVRANR